MSCRTSRFATLCLVDTCCCLPYRRIKSRGRILYIRMSSLPLLQMKMMRHYSV
ncbi:hypothetical protein ACP70R_005641 [Stipagrostis hirtigluma subsp. patula]